MPPNMLLEECSWKGIYSTKIKLVGICFAFSMFKLKQDKPKALETFFADAQVWWELPKPAASFYSIYKLLHYRVGRDSNSSWCIIIWVITWSGLVRLIYVILWHSRFRMRLYKHTDLYIALSFNTDYSEWPISCLLLQLRIKPMEPWLASSLITWKTVVKSNT